MNVLKEMYNILYPEEKARMITVLNEMLEEAQRELEELQKRRMMHIEKRY